MKAEDMPTKPSHQFDEALAAAGRAVQVSWPVGNATEWRDAHYIGKTQDGKQGVVEWGGTVRTVDIGDLRMKPSKVVLYANYYESGGEAQRAAVIAAQAGLPVMPGTAPGVRVVLES
jgi:hypothetical protein